MPRQPTGRPVGRPKGTTKLDNPIRVTVHLPTALYARLEAYADGRTFARGGTPMFAACVREAIEHYLSCPNKGQTRRPATPEPEAPAPPEPPRRRKRQVGAD